MQQTSAFSTIMLQTDCTHAHCTHIIKQVSSKISNSLPYLLDFKSNVRPLKRLLRAISVQAVLDAG